MENAHSMSNSIRELGSNHYINTDSIRALGIGISSALNHSVTLALDVPKMGTIGSG